MDIPVLGASEASPARLSAVSDEVGVSYERHSLTERVGAVLDPLIERLVLKHGLSSVKDRVWWWATMQPVPMPSGDIGFQGLLVVGGPSPLLGSPDASVIFPLPHLAALLDASMAERALDKALESLAEQISPSAQLLGL